MEADALPGIAAPAAAAPETVTDTVRCGLRTAGPAVPGREYDLWIERHVFGREPAWSEEARDWVTPELAQAPVPRYSSRDGDALRIANLLWRKHRMYTFMRIGLMVRVQVVPSEVGREPVEISQRAFPLAMCMAAALALRVG